MCVLAISDVFTTLIFLDVNFNSGLFWCLVFFDFFMLVMRDADLWDDVARWVTRQFGNFGHLLIGICEGLLAGNTDAVAEQWHAWLRAERTDAHAAEPVEVEHERAVTARCIGSLCTLSEITTNVAVLGGVAMETMTKVEHFTKGYDDERRSNTLKAYILVAGMNMAALGVSHFVREARLERIRSLKQAAAATQESPRLDGEVFAVIAAQRAARRWRNAAAGRTTGGPTRQEQRALLEETDEAKLAERRMYEKHTPLLLSLGVYCMFAAVFALHAVREAHMWATAQAEAAAAADVLLNVTNHTSGTRR